MAKRDWTRRAAAFGWTASLGLVAALLGACAGEIVEGVDDPAEGSKEAADDPAEGTREAAEEPADDEGAGGALAEIEAFIAAQDIDTTRSGWKTQLPKPPAATFGTGETYFWHLKTNVGDIKVRLLSGVAPMHVTSTIYLTQLGFYDDIIFHRVIKNFMAQGGDPLGQGSGGPGYQYGGEFDATVRHDRPGLLSMANAGPGTDGSQFFLTFVKTPHLDGKHTIFGEVVEGMETVKELEKRGSSSGATSEKLFIEKATILTE